jgi:hypothetical protein
MDKGQQQHLDYILGETEIRLSKKYKRGAMEYKTNLRDDYSASELLDCAIDEAIDQIVYLLTMREKLDGRDND